MQSVTCFVSLAGCYLLYMLKWFYKYLLYLLILLTSRVIVDHCSYYSYPLARPSLSQTLRHIHTSTIIQHHTVYSSPTRLGCYKGVCFVYNVWYQVPPNLNWRLFFRFWKAFANTVLSMSFFTFLIEELIK